jgi:hypothetical protein
MSKLIAKYQAKPTNVNVFALAKYLMAHPMAQCMATPEEILFLRTNKFIA